ncbi:MULTISPECIES: hypothetical protein [unclassified Streptomyces]|uniref:hypothetical protein n=1 Tax=unclassified Streptomyces TaxID=2593676 RepID=UPI001487815E|nr:MULTISPECIES: hypothetical protein [unclassified Streptomyces]
MDLVPAAQQTLLSLCHTRQGCGRCAGCHAVLSVARRMAPPAGEPERPAVRAAKAAWVEYGTARGMDRDAAEGMSKAALVEMLS